MIGLGLLGQLVTQYLYLSGAKEIYAIDPAESRIQLVPEKAGIHRMAMDAAKAKGEISKKTNGKMLDVVFDITGHPVVLAQATQLVNKFGRVILLGDTATPTAQGMGSNVVSNSVAILDIHGTMNYKGWDHPDMAALYLSYIMQDWYRSNKKGGGSSFAKLNNILEYFFVTNAGSTPRNWLCTSYTVLLLKDLGLDPLGTKADMRLFAGNPGMV
ncbi:zinc-binding dehydrogenase [Paenibacillus tyrfis]|uniref:zinc-binding dehydrogenase n=1 Tax=Paenibacillus tyrfis TaxID=1501230 RepID=UPI00209FFA6A|nr:zinc-binding dehydrogenase [Paenibacillus tyrfis]MCP1311794.1 zinc-binding dehydrogenase [Paenibacillus tyrfis]